MNLTAIMNCTVDFSNPPHAVCMQDEFRRAKAVLFHCTDQGSSLSSVAFTDKKMRAFITCLHAIRNPRAQPIKLPGTFNVADMLSYIKGADNDDGTPAQNTTNRHGTPN